MVSDLSQRVQLFIPSAQSPLGRRPAIWPLRPPRARKAPSAVGACIAQDTADTVYQSAVGLNRPRDM